MTRRKTKTLMQVSQKSRVKTTRTRSQNLKKKRNLKKKKKLLLDKRAPENARPRAQKSALARKTIRAENTLNKTKRRKSDWRRAPCRKSSSDLTIRYSMVNEKKRH